MLVTAGLLDLAVLLALARLARAGRAPRRFVGFARIMVAVSVAIGAWSLFLIRDMFADVAGSETGSRATELANAISGAANACVTAAAIPLAMLLVIAFLAVRKRAEVPTAVARTGAPQARK